MGTQSALLYFFGGWGELYANGLILAVERVLAHAQVVRSILTAEAAINADDFSGRLWKWGWCGWHSILRSPSGITQTLLEYPAHISGF